MCNFLNQRAQCETSLVIDFKRERHKSLSFLRYYKNTAFFLNPNPIFPCNKAFSLASRCPPTFFCLPTCILRRSFSLPACLPSNYSLTSFSAKRILIPACIWSDISYFILSACFPVLSVHSAVVLSLTAAFPCPLSLCSFSISYPCPTK